MKKMMKSAPATLFAVLAAFAPVCAATSADDGGGSLLLTLFVGFFALIVVFQLVPACLLFVGMVKGLLTRERDAVEKRSQV